MKKWLKDLLGAIVFFGVLSVATLCLQKFDIALISVGTLAYLVVNILCDIGMNRKNHEV